MRECVREWSVRWLWWYSVLSACVMNTPSSICIINSIISSRTCSWTYGGSPTARSRWWNFFSTTLSSPGSGTPCPRTIASLSSNSSPSVGSPSATPTPGSPPIACASIPSTLISNLPYAAIISISATLSSHTHGVALHYHPHHLIHHRHRHLKPLVSFFSPPPAPV